MTTTTDTPQPATLPTPGITSFEQAFAIQESWPTDCTCQIVASREFAIRWSNCPAHPDGHPAGA